MKMSHVENNLEKSTDNRHENRGMQQLKTVSISLNNLHTLHTNIYTNVHT